MIKVEQQFPVTLSYFKKHVNSERIVDNILQKIKPTKTVCRESIFKRYYIMFYARPEQRNQIPIVFNACPQRVKEKILQTVQIESNSENDEMPSCSKR